MSWGQQVAGSVSLLAGFGALACVAALIRRVFIGETGFCGGEIDWVRVAMPLLVMVSGVGAVVAAFV